MAEGELVIEALGSPAVAPAVLPGPASGLASLRSAPGAGGRVETVERGDGA